MPAYSLKFGLSATVTQQEAMDLLRNAGAEVIQTSDGLCVKSSRSLNDLKKSNEKLSKLSYQEINLQDLGSDVSEDVKSFLGYQS